MRIYALSDIHVDYELNLVWIMNIPAAEYKNDALIMAGDICHNLDWLKLALSILRPRFAEIFFVPGNHELWLRQENFKDSVEKFWYILELCRRLEIRATPTKVGGTGAGKGVWIVPLFSWYVRPEDGDNSLYIARSGEELDQVQWSDDYFIRWPNFGLGVKPADFFLKINNDYILQRFDAPVISFSHFLPRVELMFPTSEEKALFKSRFDTGRWFNFSRVAGCSALERQIRQIGSKVHIYGHQHRNRERLIDGVHYVSHCLGYPIERQNGQILAIENGLRLIWDSSEADR